eukprot:g14099.t1
MQLADQEMQWAVSPLLESAVYAQEGLALLALLNAPERSGKEIEPAIQQILQKVSRCVLEKIGTRFLVQWKTTQIEHRRRNATRPGDERASSSSSSHFICTPDHSLQELPVATAETVVLSSPAESKGLSTPQLVDIFPPQMDAKNFPGHSSANDHKPRKLSLEETKEVYARLWRTAVRDTEKKQQLELQRREREMKGGTSVGSSSSVQGVVPGASASTSPEHARARTGGIGQGQRATDRLYRDASNRRRRSVSTEKEESRQRLMVSRLVSDHPSAERKANKEQAPVKRGDHQQQTVAERLYQESFKVQQRRQSLQDEDARRYKDLSRGRGRGGSSAVNASSISSGGKMNAIGVKDGPRTASRSASLSGKRNRQEEGNRLRVAAKRDIVDQAFATAMAHEEVRKRANSLETMSSPVDLGGSQPSHGSGCGEDTSKSPPADEALPSRPRAVTIKEAAPVVAQQQTKAPLSQPLLFMEDHVSKNFASPHRSILKKSMVRPRLEIPPAKMKILPNEKLLSTQQLPGGGAIFVRDPSRNRQSNKDARKDIRERIESISSKAYTLKYKIQQRKTLTHQVLNALAQCKRASSHTWVSLRMNLEASCGPPELRVAAAGKLIEAFAGLFLKRKVNASQLSSDEWTNLIRRLFRDPQLLLAKMKKIVDDAQGAALQTDYISSTSTDPSIEPSSENDIDPTSLTPGALFLMSDLLERDKAVLKNKLGSAPMGLVGNLQKWLQAFGAMHFERDDSDALQGVLRQHEESIGRLREQDEQLMQTAIDLTRGSAKAPDRIERIPASSAPCFAKAPGGACSQSLPADAPLTLQHQRPRLHNDVLLERTTTDAERGATTLHTAAATRVALATHHAGGERSRAFKQPAAERRVPDCVWGYVQAEARVPGAADFDRPDVGPADRLHISTSHRGISPGTSRISPGTRPRGGTNKSNQRQVVESTKTVASGSSSSASGQTPLQGLATYPRGYAYQPQLLHNQPYADLFYFSPTTRATS